MYLWLAAMFAHCGEEAANTAGAQPFYHTKKLCNVCAFRGRSSKHGRGTTFLSYKKHCKYANEWMVVLRLQRLFPVTTPVTGCSDTFPDLQGVREGWAAAPGSTGGAASSCSRCAGLIRVLSTEWVLYALGPGHGGYPMQWVLSGTTAWSQWNQVS